MVEGKEKLTYNNFSIMDAWRELDSINNQLELFQTLQTTIKDKKAAQLKDIIVSKGKTNNNAILDGIIKSDQYSDKISNLYLAKLSYEKYIWEEIDCQKDIKQSVIIAFLREYCSMKWNEIAIAMNYSEKQCKRIYYDYKGRTVDENVG